MRIVLLGYMVCVGVAVATAQDIAQQQAAWEKMAKARHDGLVERWGEGGSDLALRERIATMYKKDQEARRFMVMLPQEQWTAAMAKQQQETDIALTAQLKEIVAERGWPTFRLAGVNGSQQAMLILNHSADHAWQTTMLPELEVLATRGEIDGGDLAAMVDKNLVSAGKPQRYGMNFKFVDGRMQMFAVEDPAHLAERRERAMLPPMPIYKHLLAQIYRLKETDEIAQPEPSKP